EHEAVRLVDLTRTQRPAGIDELAARGEDRNARTARARQLRDAGRSGGSQPRGGEPDPGGHHDLAAGDVAAARTDVSSRLDRLRDRHRVVSYANVLNRDNSIRILGYDCPRRDGHRAARRELPADR